MEVKFKCVDARQKVKQVVDKTTKVRSQVPDGYSFQFVAIDSTGAAVLGVQNVNRQDTSATKYVPGTVYDSI